MPLAIALAGNPNSGKTTLFNVLTGSNQFVGNWPGVTVEKKEGPLKSDKNISIVDLPGIYSLSPYTLEEVVARNYLIGERPDAILNIVDGTNIERNLYLTTQLLEIGIPVLVAVNMMDVVDKRGDRIDLKKLSQALGCETVSISALKETGIIEAAERAVVLAQKNIVNRPVHRFDDRVENALEKIESMLKGHIDERRQRFFAVKLFERDEKIGESLPSSISVNCIESIITAVESEMDDDAESIIITGRYDYITGIIRSCCVKTSQGKLTTSDKIDLIVTNRFAALPIFALVMFLVYFISVTTVGAWVTDWANGGLFGDGWHLFGRGVWVPGIPVMLENGLDAIRTADWLKSLILDGIVGGVGSVLGFVPQMLVLFIFLAFLEACGYMARIAFILDRLFRKFGLSGKSFIPILIGTGCGVPGIMASRTIENEKDRKMTIITTTFIPCGAKLPVIGLIAGALFGGAWWVAPSAYFIGIAAIVASGIILKKTRLFSGDTAPFVMELPSYHLPTAGNIFHSMWERGWSFIKKAGTIVLLASIVIWFLSSFGFVNGRFGMVENLNNGLLAVIGRGICWLFDPLGFGSWEATVAVFTGLVAKENIVGTLGVLLGFGEAADKGTEIWAALSTHFSAIAAYSFLVFNLLCAPCFAAIGAIRREMNNAKWTFFAIAYQTVFAYAVSLCVYQLGMLFSQRVFGFWTVAAILLVIFFIFMLIRPKKGLHGI